MGEKYTPRPHHLPNYVPDDQMIVTCYAAARGVSGVYFLEEAEAAARRGLAKIKADAVREAADELEPGTIHESPHVSAGRDIIRILRQHADKIEEDAG